MNELNFDEIEEVSGAGWGEIMVFVDEAVSFCKGFADGFREAQKAQ